MIPASLSVLIHDYACFLKNKYPNVAFNCQSASYFGCT